MFTPATIETPRGPVTFSPTFDGRRTIPSPECTRLMAELLDLKPGDKLLEIGTGSGTQTAAWSKSGCEVHSIELEMFVDPTKVLGECVYLHEGDGRKGLTKEAPFTAIVATCGVSSIPQAWIDQLEDGGRLVAPFGDESGQRLILFRKSNHDLSPERTAAYVRFTMMEHGRN